VSYEDLAPELTLEEQAALAGGDDDWHTVALPARGIPRLKVTDGPSGARGESYTTTTSASFPCGSALGASFDVDLVARVAGAIADDARTKGAHVVLGPTLNLHRHPLGGRNFESFGEDPLLVGRIGAAYVRGMQERGVGACPKHLVANDAEIDRLTISSEVDERTLREVYLRPFDAALRDGGAWSVMASYNRLNGTFACEEPALLSTLVKGEWNFDGVVMSDWYATHDTVRCAAAGLDLEMPGPVKHFGAPLVDAVKRGDVDADLVADKARRLLRLLDRVGAETGPEPAERSEDDPARWALAREAAAAAMVLLVNRDEMLPLAPAALRRVAVIGPNADVAIVQGGGSARVTPHRAVTPLEGLRARLVGVEVVHEPGASRGGLPAVLDARLAPAGIRVDYREERGGDVLFTTVLPRLDPVWSGQFSSRVDPGRFHVTATATLQPSRSGLYVVDVTSVGPCVVRLDGDVLLDNRQPGRGVSFFGMGSAPVTSTVELTAGRSYVLEVEYGRPPTASLAGIRVGVEPPLGEDPIAAAAELAAGVDVAVVVVGTDSDWETEGIDRSTMALPGDQDALVRAVAAANPRTVVVVNAGAAVDMPWADDVAAVLVAWFPGMAWGEALARVLVGDDEPGGRLPFTVPVDLGDAPCDISRPDPPGQLRYTEGVLVGHRWYLTQGIRPRWWFGAGQSYTTFAWGEPSVVGARSVRVPVTNTGPRRGSEVVQAYVRRPASAVDRPAWVLGGFTKVTLEPGATADATIDLDAGALRHWAGAAWQVEPGPAEVRLARSAGDPGTVVTMDLLLG
jgi:beta-glucosidase